jgi:SAM-dependent methyltransferase
MGMIRRALIDPQIRLCRAIDVRLPRRLRAIGAHIFRDEVIPRYLGPGKVVWDVGSGSQPTIDAATKARLGLHVVGLDISQEELRKAPPDTLDRAIVADIAIYQGDGCADLVICRSTLEHVRDTGAALRAIASILEPGGLALIFVPCRNAPFALVNRMLRQGLKERLLYTVWPQKNDGHAGFPAFYQDCTPRDLSRLAGQNGLMVRELRTFYNSSYFRFLVPLYLVWRLWTIVAATVSTSLCEAFIMVLERER